MGQSLEARPAKPRTTDSRIGPSVRASRTEPVFPSQEQIGRDPLISLSIGKGDERTQDEAAGCQVRAVATTL